MASTDIPGRRQPIDFENSGLGGVNVPDDGAGGLVQSQVGYAEPTVPTFLSPGNQRKLDLNSERN